MNSDLVATEKPPLRKRLSIKTRLKLQLRARKLSRTQQLYSEPLVGDQNAAQPTAYTRTRTRTRAVERPTADEESLFTCREKVQKNAPPKALRKNHVQ